jgi:hypothetical protein
MPAVYLKTGETVEIPVEELADYLSQNRDNIQPQKLKRRGPMYITSHVNLIGNPS